MRGAGSGRGASAESLLERMEKSRGGSTFTMSAIKRIQSDLKEIKKYPIEGVAVEATEQLGRWTIFMEGPKGTPL